jgi:hypothetical protein
MFSSQIRLPQRFFRGLSYFLQQMETKSMFAPILESQLMDVPLLCVANDEATAV